MSGTLYVGTSGFAYKTWKPGFYPEKLKAAQMLRFYSERLPSVEINNTFYRMPSEKLLAGWREETPQTFRFTLKAPQRITHIGRLRDVGDPLRHFLDTARTLGPRLGGVVFPCPPHPGYDRPLMSALLCCRRRPDGVVPRRAPPRRHWIRDGVPPSELGRPPCGPSRALDRLD